MYPSMIWIVSSRNVLVFSTIDDQEVIYFCPFCIQVFRECGNIVLGKYRISNPIF